MNTTNPAAFEPTDRNAVTGVGAPWYTSGTQIWNGTAAILKPSAMESRTKANISGAVPCRRGARRIMLRQVGGNLREVGLAR